MHTQSKMLKVDSISGHYMPLLMFAGSCDSALEVMLHLPSVTCLQEWGKPMWEKHYFESTQGAGMDQATCLALSEEEKKKPEW